ncbi:hypothetical protein D3C71_1931420 [compost metagenome]
MPVSPSQNQRGSGRLCCKAFTRPKSGRAQYTPRTYSRQPRIWRMNPSTLASGNVGSLRQAASAACTTSCGDSILVLSAKLSPL